MTAAIKNQHHTLTNLLHVENTLELLSFLLLGKITCKFITQLWIPAFIYNLQKVSQPSVFCKETCKSFSMIHNCFLFTLYTACGKDNICNKQQTYKYFWNILVVTWLVHGWFKQFYFCTYKHHVLGGTFYWYCKFSQIKWAWAIETWLLRN